MATLKQTNDEINAAIRALYRKGIGDMNDFLERDKLTIKLGYLKTRLETCKREAAAIPSVEAELAEVHQKLEQFNARIGA